MESEIASSTFEMMINHSRYQKFSCQRAANIACIAFCTQMNHIYQISVLLLIYVKNIESFFVPENPLLNFLNFLSSGVLLSYKPVSYKKYC